MVMIPVVKSFEHETPAYECRVIHLVKITEQPTATDEIRSSERTEPMRRACNFLTRNSALPSTAGASRRSHVDPPLGKDLATNGTVEGKLGKFFNKKRKRNEKEEKFL
ncbi:hypothetical protein RUM44_006159 [Polyplax serrata]|uniref:Uncharacterized protein n=1 Tax=Polyplax serrata TaxID=468196 RepID=A0ABR1AZ38_POLSC